jgi:hypothetical protein
MLKAVLLAATAVTVSACAAPGPRTEAGKAESPKSAPIASEEAIVFGKLELVRDSKETKVGRISIFGMGTAALVLPEAASTALVLHMDEQGWFAWNLKPGSYRLLGFVSQAGNKTWFERVDARFDAVNDDTAVYVGHINLEINGPRHSVSIRDSETEAREEMRKRYGDTVSPAKRLLQRGGKLGTYVGVRSVCDKEWGLQCTRELQGVTPIHPALTRGIHGTTFGRIDGASPTLKWQRAAALGVSYDVAVWEAASYRLPSQTMSDYIPGHLALYEENLVAPELTLTKPLKPKTRYFWSVRARDGDVVSSWSRAGYFTFLVVAWTSGSGEWFAFETP